MQSVSTTAILLRTIKYSETSAVVHAYTEAMGRIALLARGIYGAKNRRKARVLQPMNVVEMTVTKTNKSDLYYLKEIAIDSFFPDIASNVVKRSIIMFINEILYKTLQEELPNTPLFDYIRRSLSILEQQKNDFSDFHLLFLAGMTKYLGIAPNFSQQGDCFDLLNGAAQQIPPSHPYYIDCSEKKLFENTFREEAMAYHPIGVDYLQRQRLLDALLRYYELHIPEMGNIKSREVLHEILR